VKKKDLLTPVYSQDLNENKYTTYKDIYEILRTIPGVEVSGRNITIQGVSTLTSSTEPLYVVDGMTVSSLDGIPTVEIENVSVLKGAAASIYGSRSANGVIIVNLKKAKR
jgi:TonB-dependent SusC/RagA subfamily outer membrane receptor